MFLQRNLPFADSVGGGGGGESSERYARFSIRDISNLRGGGKGQEAPAPGTEMIEQILATKQNSESNSFKSG